MSRPRAAIGNPRWRVALFHISAEHHAGAVGAGDALDRDRDHRRGRACRFLGLGPAAARALIGVRCSTQRSASSRKPRGWPCGRGLRSSSPSFRSTWSATACATRSIRRSVRARNLAPAYSGSGVVLSSLWVVRSPRGWSRSSSWRSSSRPKRRPREPSRGSPRSGPPHSPVTLASRAHRAARQSRAAPSARR